ncbi:alpha-1,2-Mannosidase [Mycena indigotica]|uniref:alpha-1,2-Mannosidase n=1 Tax=Mycena indigotica TaxID=2126181 RepID=A0A8H6W0V9_9AGAR|nr:alpha-1,2-Mannosidase [Mycena indigotica]KAF7298936.1 alpha-1,2-Mannosidase [Mycena indigotica]
MSRRALATVLGLSSAALAGVTVQLPGLVVPPAYGDQRDAAELIFTKSWDAYRQFAFGHDELDPIAKQGNDDLGGWGATIVDALPTMLVMGLTDRFNDALNFTSTVDFSKSPAAGTVSVFETTIRWLGGLISAYELSDGQHPILLQKAKEVADQLSNAWVGSNPIPYGHMTIATGVPNVDTTNIAEAGTLSLEWHRLSELSGNDTYSKLGVGSARIITQQGTPLPGLAPQVIHPENGHFGDSYITWGGGSDSYFEYLIKFARLTNTDDHVFADTWATAVDSSIKNLLKVTISLSPTHPKLRKFTQKSTVGNWSFLADRDDNGRIRHVGSHLACFYAGNWLLGGKLLNNQTIIDIALELNDGCWNTYASTATGIGPETFAFIGTDGNFTGGSAITPSQQAFFNQHGYYITGADYIQRPEVLESNFHAWRVTGDTKYLDRAKAAIASFNKFLTGSNIAGFASLNNVNSANGGFIDITESFWFAEVLKYLYLTFDDPSHISLDDFVFNTECHPLKAPPALDSYGSGKFVPNKAFAPIKTTGPRPAVSPRPGQ